MKFELTTDDAMPAEGPVAFTAITDEGRRVPCRITRDALVKMSGEWSGDHRPSLDLFRPLANDIHMLAQDKLRRGDLDADGGVTIHRGDRRHPTFR